ncbi:MAG: hypothetical protein SFU99_01870 [Saprospiraceae bacterium]|nr:hypothetical protein [Saprospiraceae bacterium]
MLKNYFKIAWRNLLKNKVFSLVNIIGLTTGLTCTFLIYLWVNDELHIDKFHEKDKQLYQAMLNQPTASGIATEPATPGPLAEALVTEMPEIEYAVATTSGMQVPPSTLSTGDKDVKAIGLFAGQIILICSLIIYCKAMKIRY